MSLRLVFLLCIILIVSVDCRRLRGGTRGVNKAGSYLGNSVVNIVNWFRGKPTPMPKNYKRQYEPPPKEQHTLWFKFKNGLKNFLYLGYAIILAVGAIVCWKIYLFTAKLYYRHKLSTMPKNNTKQLDEYRKVQKILRDLDPPENSSSPRIKKIK